MGFLDSVRSALKDAISTQTSKGTASKGAAPRDQAVTKDESDSTAPIPADPETDTIDTEAAEPATAVPPVDARHKREDARETRFETYTVKTGDTLPEIGARFGVSHLEIAKLNSIENPDLIFPGQVFRIPTS